MIEKIIQKNISLKYKVKKFWLALACSTVLGLSQDYQNSGVLYTQARNLSSGLAGPVQRTKAKELYRKAARMGDPRALAWEASLVHYQGQTNEAKAAFLKIETKLEEMAKNNLPEAKRSLASSWGVLFPKEKGSQAFQYIQDVSAEASAFDQYDLGWFYELGIGTKVDLPRALEFYRKSAEAGNAYGIDAMALLFEQGKGVPKDATEAVRWYTRAADRGDGWAMNRLAGCYENGSGVEKSQEKAFDTYRKSADLGDEWGQNNLGNCYYHGRGTVKDFEKAYGWYKKSAEQGNGAAMVNLGYYHENGIGITPDKAEAVRWYQKAAERGTASAFLRLAVCYEKGSGIEKDPGKALAFYLQAAEKGEFWAEENVARCYADGIGTQKNPEEARKWYGRMRTKLEEESKKNEAWSWDNLGRYYFNGLGVEKDYAKALKCYHKAAKLKSGWAMEQIGWCYEKGHGVQPDDREALRWYLQAADKGQAWSMGQCAVFYENGRGTEKNPAEAFRWWNRKAEKGDFWAPENVARCHAEGIGTPKNQDEAAKWYGKVRTKLEEKAAANEAWAWDNLGRFYYRGLGVEKNYPKALECYRKAAELKSGWAMEQIGWCYEKGDGVAKDEKEALRWYLQAADKGQAWSMGQCAVFYENGRGTEKNPAEAFRWWNRKAEMGDFWAPENVARCYANGIGTAKNQEEAVKWYGKVRAKLEEKTAANEAWAWDNLGRFYFNGLGVESDYAKALECYRKAAELKSGWAMGQIGWCYEKGLGVRVDEKEALQWYLQAAEAGQEWPMGQCAIFYESGRGTEKKPVEAYRWYRKKAETGAGDPWADENVGRCHEKAIGTKKDDAEALRWYEKAAQKGSLWAGEQAGRFYQEGIGTKINPETAYQFFLPSVRDKRHWAQYRIVALGSSRYYEGEYEFAERCFQAAWESGYRPAANWLHQLHTQSAQSWERADPLRGIQIKRASLRGQPEEAEESGTLAGQAMSLGYLTEARQMIEELLASEQIRSNNEQKARWHVLAGYAALVEDPIDPLRVQGRTIPEKWLLWLENSPSIGVAAFNIKLVHPQSLVDFRHSGDFVAPVAPRRWASYLIQQIKWGVKIWKEQGLRGYRTLVLTATGGPGKGGSFLWAGFPLQNRGQADEQFQIAETLAPNFAAQMGRAILAWQDQDADKVRAALDLIQKELAEKRLAATEKRKQKNPDASETPLGKSGWSLQVENLAHHGVVPWGNAMGEVGFGFGFAGGSGIFYGQLTSAIWKLVVPFVLWLKSDWLLVAAEVILRLGMLSPMQLVELYESLAEKEETRGKACARLAMIQVQLGEKEAAWEWAQQAAKERPTDAEVLRMTAAIADWVGKTKDAERWQGQFYEAQARRELLSQDSPATEYLRIFEALQEAEKLEALKKTSEAEPKFRKVLKDLKRLRDHHPDWESSSIVQYRIRVLEKKLAPPQQKP
jgi:TPR repeat protein